MEHHTIDSLLRDSSWLREICRQMTSDESAAEDLLQEGWTQVLRHGGAGIDAPRPWFRRIVWNLRVGGFRSGGARRARELDHAGEREERHENMPSPDEVLERAELRSSIARAVLDLEEPIRGTLMLRFFEERTLSEIADEYGVSAETVRKRMNQGLEQVRRELERNYPGEKGSLLSALFLAAGRRPEVVPTALVPAGKLSASSLLFFLGAACVFIIVAMWAVVPDESKDPELFASGQTEVPGEAAQKIQSAGAAVSREALVSEVAPGPVPVQGLLWSASLQAPLAGALRDAEGQIICLAGRGGGFVLAPEWSGKELTASAQHHGELILTVPEEAAEGSWKVELDAAVPTTLRIVNAAGKPMEGIPIAIWPWGGHAPTVDHLASWDAMGPATVRGASDAEGYWSTLIGGAAAARIEVPGGAVKYVRVQPGVMSTITLPSRSLTVRFLDARDGTPMPGLLVRMGRNRSVANRDALFQAREQLTDRMGQLILAHGDQETRFHVASYNATNLALKNPVDSEWATIEGRSNETVLVQGSDTNSELTLLVEDDSLRMHLTDAQTGQDLVGQVTYGYNSIWRKDGVHVMGARKFRGDGNPGRLVKGIFRLNSIRGRPRERLPNSEPRYRDLEPLSRLVIQAPGYQTAYLTRDEQYSGERLLNVQMRRTPNPTHRLRFCWADGSPFWGEVSVSRKDSFEVLAGGRTDVNGRLKPMHVPEGTARILATSTNEPAGGDVPIGRQGMRHRYILEVEPSDWGPPGDVLVKLEGVPICGQITVTDVPKGAPEIIASDPMQFEHAPTRYEEGCYVFENLPAGEYIVGPRKWVRALVAQHVYGSEGMGSPLIAMVNPDSNVQKRWRADWYLEEPLSGRVKCDPKVLGQAILVARYGSARSRNSTGRQRVNMDALGNYVIPAGDPRPVGLKLLYGKDRKSLATFQPGKGCIVQTGSMRLKFASKGATVAWIGLNTKPGIEPSDAKSYEDAKFLSISRPDGNECLLEGLPMSIVEVRFVTDDNQSVARTVKMIPGGEVVVSY